MGAYLPPRHESGYLCQSIVDEEQACVITALEFSPCGTWLAAGDSRGRVRIFCSADGTLVQTVASHNSPTTSLCWESRQVHQTCLLFAFADGYLTRVSINFVSRDHSQPSDMPGPLVTRPRWTSQAPRPSLQKLFVLTLVRWKLSHPTQLFLNLRRDRSPKSLFGKYFQTDGGEWPF